MLRPLIRFALVAGLLSSPAFAFDVNKVTINAKLITVEEKKDSKDDKKVDSKGNAKRRPPETHRGHLEIELQNVTKTAYPGSKVKWFIFVRSAGGMDVAVLLQGEDNADIPGPGNAKVESKSATITFQPAGFEKKQHVRASGQKFAGWGVQVFQGDTIISQKFEPEGLKDKAPK